MLQAFLDAIDAFHVAQEKVANGIDPQTGAALDDATAALDAAAARLTQAMHTAIEAGWIKASADALNTMWGKAEAPVQAARVLESEVARQKAFASRFALDIARGETEEKRKIPEPTRAAMYADAAEAGYQVGASLGAPDGALIWWKLSPEAKSCWLCPVWASSSPYSRETLPALPRDGTSPCVFTPDSPVLTKRGEVPICDVVPGDEVWTHRSRWRTVLRTRVNPSAGRRGVYIDGVGLTEDHEVWTADGWIAAGEALRNGAHMLHTQHAKDLREMFGPDALGSAYESLPTVRELLSLRATEGPAGGGVPVLRDEPQSEGAVGRPGEEAPNPRGGDCPREEGPDAIRGSDLGEFHVTEGGGLPLLGQLLGRRPQTDGVPIPVGLDEGERSHPRWLRDPPHQRGSDGRPIGEPADAHASRASQRAHAERSGDADGGGARRQAAARAGAPVRELRGNLHGQASPGARGVPHVLLDEVLSGGEVQAAGEALQELRADVSANADEGARLLLPSVLGRIPLDVDDPGLRNVRGNLHVHAAQEPPAEVLFVEVLPPHVYDLEVEEDHSFLVGGVFAANCRSRCKCHLDIRPAEGVKFPTPEDRERDRRFEERVLNPPPVPPGMRLPTPEERGTLRDLEIQRNFARRKQADADARGSKGEARLWQQKSRELTKNIREFSEANGIHHVPTFSVGDVIAGKDIGQRDIDRLTHFRGIDGVTVSRAQVAAIKEATAAAKADVLKVLGNYPAADAVSREEWRRLLKANGAPESAFGGELTRLAREGCDHEHEGRMTVRARPALGLVAAVEAKVPDVTVEVLPSPADWRVVNLMAETVRETLENHVAAYALLGAAGRRTGIEPYRVEVGPFDDWDMVAVGGTWVQGDAAEVRRFCEALRAMAPAGFAVATWQAMG